MPEVEMSDIQQQVFNTIKQHGEEGISKRDIATELGISIHKINTPIRALTSSGGIVEIEEGRLTLAAGVEEKKGDEKRIIVSSQPKEDESFDSYSPEELVTFYQEEGMDYLKRKALSSALKSVPGVGSKSDVCILHIFDADMDVRSEPTELMRALEDCGVRKALLGRIVREVFLVEKLYGSYLKEGSNIVIDQRRKRVEGRTIIRDTGHRDPGNYDNLDYQDREGDVGEKPPRWLSNLRGRLDDDARGRTSETPKPIATVEPVLDKHGKPVEDPNNPGHYLEKRVIYSDDGEGDIRSRSRRFQSRFDEGDYTGHQGDATSPALKKMEKDTEALRDEVAKLKDLLQEHETDKKIGDAVNPLMDKIHALESRKHGSSTGNPLSDTQFKAQSERETIELISETADRNVERMLSPILESQGALQRVQMLQQVIMMEKVEGVPSGTFLKYLSPSTEAIDKDRVRDTLKKLEGVK